MPTLLLTGEKSPGLMRKLTDRLQERLPHASRVSIPGASHDAHVDNASAVADAIDGFLGALETTSGRERHGLHGSAPGRS
jgi:pimeloyl-ACP methyl ester carboxylesterase